MVVRGNMTPEKVRNIKRLGLPQDGKPPKCTQLELARLYDVRQPTISNILRGKTWKDVNP